MLVESGQSGDRFDNIGRFVHYDDTGRAKAALHLDKAVEIHQYGVADFLRQNRSRRTARDHPQQIVPAAAHPAGMALDQLLERDAHRVLDVARPLDMALQAIDLGPGVAGPADAGKPGCAALQDFRRNSDGFDVVDGRRASIKTNLSRKRRLQPRLPLARLEAFEQRRLLAADISAGAAVQIAIHIVAGAAGVLAEQPGVVCLLDCYLDVLRLVIELAANVDVRRGDAHAEPGEQAPFEQAMRIVPQYVAVLAGAGFALVGVDDQIAGPVTCLRHERPFEAGGESSTAAAAQSRILDLLDDPVPPLEDDVASAVPDPAPSRPSETPIILAVEIGEDAVPVSEHRSPRGRQKPAAKVRSAWSCRRPASIPVGRTSSPPAAVCRFDRHRAALRSSARRGPHINRR